jgi:hypothetical protein
MLEKAQCSGTLALWVAGQAVSQLAVPNQIKQPSAQ